MKSFSLPPTPTPTTIGAAFFGVGGAVSSLCLTGQWGLGTGTTGWGLGVGSLSVKALSASCFPVRSEEGTAN